MARIRTNLLFFIVCQIGPALEGGFEVALRSLDFIMVARCRQPPTVCRLFSGHLKCQSFTLFDVWPQSDRPWYLIFHTTSWQLASLSMPADPEQNSDP